MKKFCLTVFLIISFISIGVSQKTLSDYTYVIVPSEYGFLNEKDEYQLNSLTKFLFNKYGFNAYFDEEVPVDVRRCDGLWAGVLGSPGFVYTKIVVILKDCYGAEVYRSEEGVSKEKNFKKAYYEAMRKSFESIEVLGVKQKKVSNFKEEIDVTNVNSSLGVAIINEEVTNVENLPVSKYTTYSRSGIIYLLKKTKEGYKFYKESTNGEDDLLSIGRLIVAKDTVVFLDENANKYEAYFDDSTNLTIEKEGQVLVYKLEN